MSRVVYKQRHIQSSEPKAEGKNYAHIMYIAKRHGVVRHMDSQSGLFGKLNAMDEMTNFTDPNEVAKLVYRNTESGTVMLRGIISVKPETADELGLKTMDDWKRYAERMIVKLREGNGIKAENLAYVCAVHQAKGHPHIHFAFWDKTRQNPKYFIKPEKVDSIRTSIIRESFRSLLSELHEGQDASLKEVRNINIMKGVGLSGRIAINKRIKETLGELPEKGRLNYKLLSPEAKKKMDNLVKVILANSPVLSGLRRNYVELKLKEAEVYGGDENSDDKIFRFEKQLDKVLANAVLKHLKDNYISGGNSVSSDLSKSSVFGALNSLLSVISSISSARANTRADNIKKADIGAGDKSREARKIIAKKHQESQGELEL